MTATAFPRGVAALDGCLLHVEVTGTGRTVLLIHGLGYGTWAWQPQVAGLGRGYRVVALDNRGSGPSDKPPGPYSIRLLAEDALAVMERTDAPPAHALVAEERQLVGSYMGSAQPRRDLPRLIALYEAGLLPRDELHSATVRLKEINTAFDRLAAGQVARQVINLGADA